MISIVNASKADIRKVFADLSSVSKNEMNFEKDGHQFEIHKVFCAADEKGPLFVFGIGPTAPGEWRTSFAGTQRYFDMGAAGVRLMRRFVHKLMDDHPGDTFVSHTRSTHSAVVRWYRLLGGKLADHKGGRFTFRFEPDHANMPIARHDEASRTLATPT